MRDTIVELTTEDVMTAVEYWMNATVFRETSKRTVTSFASAEGQTKYGSAKSYPWRLSLAPVPDEPKATEVTS